MPSISIEQFQEEIESLQKDMARDYPGLDPDQVEQDPDIAEAMCHVMHRDLDLSETVSDNADEIRENLKQRYGKDVEDGALELTDEHQDLHRWLLGIMADFAQAGALNPMGLPQVLATMFVIGRRYGLREAGAALGDLSIDSDWLTEFNDSDGGDTTGPKPEA